MNKLRKLWKIVFGRTAMFAVLIIIQAVILFGGFAVLGRAMWVLNYLMGILAVIILMYILNNKINTGFKMMWIILILVTPIIGVAFYLYTRVQPGTRFITNRIEVLTQEEQGLIEPHPEIVEKVKGESRHEYGFFKYLYERGHFPAYDNASVKYFPLGEDKYKELVYQLERAEDFIFMEYFIVERGEMWNTILDILVRKVRQGVEVRFMYDGTCTLSLLPKNYPAYLNKLGINCKVFAPMKPLLSTHQNNRDHRKIAIIDGRVAFTGGVNLADEYINKKRRFGHWKDTAIMVGGEAVNSFTLMFLQMWNIDEHRPENYGRYLRTGSYTEPGMRVGGFVAPYGDCPYSKEEIGERVYLDVLNKAKDYVHIMTPYLILDEEFINTLIYTAQRGVDVKLILPHIPDKKYAYLLARTHYKELISEGVQIYEYVPGFVHAKVFVSDDERAVVGTINLDYRSLYLHFECAAYIWKNPAVFDVEDDFQSTLKKCMRIDMQNCEEYSLVGKIVGKALKLVAPLM